VEVPESLDFALGAISCRKDFEAEGPEPGVIVDARLSAEAFKQAWDEEAERLRVQARRLADELTITYP
jgi:ribosomal protein L31E